MKNFCLSDRKCQLQLNGQISFLMKIIRFTRRGRRICQETEFLVRVYMQMLEFNFSLYKHFIFPSGGVYEYVCILDAAPVNTDSTQVCWIKSNLESDIERASLHYPVYRVIGPTECNKAGNWKLFRTDFNNNFSSSKSLINPPKDLTSYFIFLNFYLLTLHFVTS